MSQKAKAARPVHPPKPQQPSRSRTCRARSRGRRGAKGPKGTQGAQAPGQRPGLEALQGQRREPRAAQEGVPPLRQGVLHGRAQGQALLRQLRVHDLHAEELRRHRLGRVGLDRLPHRLQHLRRRERPERRDVLRALRLHDVLRRRSPSCSPPGTPPRPSSSPPP